MKMKTTPATQHQELILPRTAGWGVTATRLSQVVPSAAFCMPCAITYGVIDIAKNVLSYSVFYLDNQSESSENDL